MFEIPQKTFAAPPPLPVTAAPSPLITARPVRSQVQNEGPSTVLVPPPPSSSGSQTDKVAVASTICGLTPFIPIFSQVVGLLLGVWALFRIRRARNAGQTMRGRGWATAGITGNGFVLLCWLVLFGMFAALKGTLSETTEKLNPLLKKPPAHHLRVRK